MKKFIHEQKSNELNEKSTYLWPKSLLQHPLFAFSESFESKQYCTLQGTEDEVYCVYNGIRFCNIK
jgi:hypothetical protein